MATKAAIVEKPVECESHTNHIQQLAYFKWLAATGGSVLSEDPEGKQFWLEAEKELNDDKPCCKS